MLQKLVNKEVNALEVGEIKELNTAEVERQMNKLRSNTQSCLRLNIDFSSTDWGSSTVPVLYRSFYKAQEQL